MRPESGVPFARGAVRYNEATLERRHHVGEWRHRAAVTTWGASHRNVWLPLPQGRVVRHRSSGNVVPPCMTTVSGNANEVWVCVQTGCSAAATVRNRRPPVATGGRHRASARDTPTRRTRTVPSATPGTPAYRWRATRRPWYPRRPPRPGGTPAAMPGRDHGDPDEARARGGEQGAETHGKADTPEGSRDVRTQ